MAEGKLVSTRILEPSGSELPAEWRGRLPPDGLVLEHSPIPFRNYPYEWAPPMLQAAARLTLELAVGAMREGFSLKDATPYNVMFDGAKPVFLDVLSFRRRDPLESLWPPFAQFMRTFAFPLLASRHFGLCLDEVLLAHRDGLEPERVWELCPPYKLLLPPFFSSVTIPVFVARSDNSAAKGGYGVRRAKDADEATFILERLFRRAGRLVSRASNRRRRNATVEYMDSGHRYEQGEFAAKERTLATALERWSPKRVLDLGSNTGHFSDLAIRYGARVVAIDRDADSVGMLWQSAGQAGAQVLPLVVDIGRPPGACGWQNNECAAFLDRARGAFDCVLMLALVHHLLVNERVPLDAVLDLAAELTTDLAIVEYIDPSDFQFRQIARGRDELHQDVTRERFEGAARRCFQILDANDVSPTRRIYILRKKEPESCRAAS